MPEVKEVNATPSQQTATPAAPRPTPPRPANQGKKKLIKRLLALGVTAAIVAGLGFGMWYLVFRDSSTLGTPMTAIAELGSIQQTAEGYGTAVPPALVAPGRGGRASPPVLGRPTARSKPP